MEWDDFVRLCSECGYLSPSIKNGERCAIAPFIFTWAIMVGIDECGYSHRFCYDSLSSARDNYDRWDGSGEPAGYIKRKGNGAPAEQGEAQG